MRESWVLGNLRDMVGKAINEFNSIDPSDRNRLLYADILYEECFDYYMRIRRSIRGMNERYRTETDYYERRFISSNIHELQKLSKTNANFLEKIADFVYKDRVKKLR